MISIALATFKEALRKKIFLLVGIITFIYLVLLTLITYYACSQNTASKGSFDIYMMASSFISILGFYFSSMLVAFLTIMASVGSISSETESGILHSIITRPIKRRDYILGKYLGLAILTVLYSIFLYAALLIIYLVIQPSLVHSFGTLVLVKGLLFFILEPLAILALSLYSSSSFKTLGSGIFVIAIYILGLIGGIVEQVGSAVSSDTVYKIGIISSLISPFDVIYRKLTNTFFGNVGMTNSFFVPGSISNTAPSTFMTIYVFAYIIGLILITVRKFKKKDIG
ncbi:MAG: ABC transporter permease subunit [Bacillota bacterium]|nr:ABC transporter permease subunit [Bacillota bacterium]